MRRFLRQIPICIAILLMGFVGASGITTLIAEHAAAIPNCQSPYVYNPDTGTCWNPSAPTNNSGPAGWDAVTDLNQKAILWTELAAINHCSAVVTGGRTGTTATLSNSDVLAGKWFSGTTDFGMHVDSQDGQLDCDNENGWFTGLMDAAGYKNKYTELYKQTNGNPSQVYSALVSALFPIGKPPTIPDDVKYDILVKAFMHGGSDYCAATEDPGTPDGRSKYSDGPVQIWLVDPSTHQPVQKTYYYNHGAKSSEEREIPVGWQVNPGKSRYLCKTLASLLSEKKFAQAVATDIAIGSVDPQTVVDSTGSTAGDQKDPTGCNLNGDVLTWILCPIIKDLEDGIQWLDGFITHSLIFDTCSVFNASCTTSTYQPGFYQAWNSFRILASALLVIAGIIMVIAQAMGLEVFDAYTVKKVLPRLLIAIIGISLSWPLMDWAISLFNTIGLDVRELIYSPFSQIKGDLAASTLFVFGAGFVYLFATLGPAIFTFLLTALLAVLVGYLIILVRYMAILVLIVFAPLAIASFVLPNTKKLWDIWKDNFLGMLLVFPIISGFIAIGHVFSAITLDNSAKPDAAFSHTAMQAIGFVMYFLPYFLLPIAFRMVTGMLGTIAGFVNDRSKGGFDYLKNKRGAAKERNVAAMKAGTRFNNGALNAMTARASTRNLGFGARGRAAYKNKMDLAAGAFAQSDQGKAIMHEDPILQAMTYNSEMEARNRLADDYGMNSHQINEAIAGVKASGGFGKARSVWAAKQLAATGTGYENDAQMLATIARVSGGNKELAHSMWGEMRGTSERAGRNDLKAGFGMGTNMLDKIIDNGDARANYQTLDNKYTDDFQEFGLDAARGVDNMTLLQRNKPKSISNLSRRLDQGRVRHAERAADTRLTAGQREYSEVALGQISAKLNNMKTHTNYGPEVNAEAVHGSRTVKDQEIVGGRKYGTAGAAAPPRGVEQPEGLTIGDAADYHASSPAAQEARTEETLQRTPRPEDLAQGRGDEPGAAGE